MHDNLKQIIKKINYIEFDIKLSHFQKLCTSVLSSVIIIYLMFDLMNDFLKTFQSITYIAVFVILFWFLSPFLAFASSKGCISIVNRDDWLLLGKAFFKSLAVCLFSLILCFLLFLTGCIKIFVGYSYFVFLVSFQYFILNYVSKEEPFIHKRSENKISIVGPINSGKTVFLIILIQELIKDNSWDFKDTNVEPITDMYSHYIRKGKFPPATTINNLMDKKFSWDILISKKENKNLLVQPIAFSINVADSSGGLFDHYDSERFKNDSYGYVKRVSNSSALILILPVDYQHTPEILNKTLQANFKQILKQFKTDKIPIPVAICLSKIDKHYSCFSD